MKRAVSGVAVLAAGAVLLTSCGPSGLSRTAFDKQANAICTTVDAQVKQIAPPNKDDLASIGTYASATERAYQSYLTQITALAKKAKDHKEIEQSWVTPANQDFAAEKPLLDALVTAAEAGNADQIATAIKNLQKVTDHTASIQAFQKKYGATECSTLLNDIGR